MPRSNKLCKKRKFRGNQHQPLSPSVSEDDNCDSETPVRPNLPRPESETPARPSSPRPGSSSSEKPT